MTSLTQAEAAARAAAVRPLSTTVVLDLTSPEAAGFRSSTTLRFSGHGGRTTFVDVRPVRLLWATVNGRALDLATAFDAATGRLTVGPLDDVNEVVVEAEMSYSHDGEGLVRHRDPADGATYLYAMSFLDAAPRWFACFDQPDLRTPVRLVVSCPPDWTVAGNAPAVTQGPGRWTIDQPHPIATYLATLVAGPYYSVRAEHDGIPLALHCRASLAEHLDRDAERLFAHTGRCLDRLHELFGVRYPWGEYHQAFVPDFNAGAMENPGCVTFRDSYLFRGQVTEADRDRRDVTIAHEMAHMWFGDLVTMTWWDDLWLNESFAEYLGSRVSSPDGNWVGFGIERKAWGHLADRRPSTHPVAGNGAPDARTALDAFDGISYAKGAAALRQLAARQGDEVFLAGLREHIARHAFGNARLADLLDAWRAAGDPGIDAWADAWLRTSGMDTLRIDGNDVLREPPAAGEPTREHAVVAAGVNRDGVVVASRRLVLDGPRTPHGLPADFLVVPDADDETWARLALPQASWAAMPALLPRLPAPTRVAVWNAMRLAVTDAELDPAAAIDVVVAGVAHETLDVVLGEVVPWSLTVLCAAYLGAGGERIAAASWLAVEAAGPAGGRRLAALRGWVDATGDVARLRAALGGDLPDGVRLDHDLRWRLIGRLARLGAVDADDIGRALASDPTSEGNERAAWARAALPDAGAKRSAWELIMRDTDVANSILYAAAGGFWQPGQDALVAPYVRRYFDEIAATSAMRSGWVVSRVADLAYPRTAVRAATLVLTDDLLGRPDVPGPIRRAVLDRGDDLRRALVSRRRFGLDPDPV